MSEAHYMRPAILEEHAYGTEEGLQAEVQVKGQDSEPIWIRVRKQENEKYYSICTAGEEEELSFEEMRASEYADFFLIAIRMLRDLEGRYARSRYDIIQKRTRMVQNLYSKIPESEIEIAFLDGEHYYLFAYESNSFVEYGISRISWIDQEEEGYQVDRETDILESYDSLQESLSSDFAALFLELQDMMCNAEDLPDELFEEYEEENLPGYYMYEE